MSKTHCILFLVFLFIGISSKAQSKVPIIKDRTYKTHCDSSTYYKNLWEKSGRMNPEYQAKMSQFRTKAMDRSWHIYDSTERSKAKKP